MATIQIADNDARVQYTQAVTADTTQLTIDFPFFDLDDINVIVTAADGTDTTLSRGTGTGTFAVVGTSVDDGFSGGYVTLGDTYSDASTKYTIFRDVPVTRTTDFPTSGPFNISSLNTELDKIFAIEQELETKIGRTMKLADSDTAATLSLPNLDTRKGTVLAFNETTGLPEAGPEIGDVSSISAITADISTLADIEDGTDATDAIQTVAGISSNVTTVAGISGNVTTVAGISSDVTAVAGDATDIGTVATNISNVNTVAGISSNVTTVAGISSDVTAVAADATDIGAVAAKATEIGRLGTADAVADLAILGTADAVADMNTLGTAANVTNMDTLAGISANITTVAGISADVTTVAGDAADIATVAADSADIQAVAADGTDIGLVAGQISPTNNISTVAGISSNITTVAGNNANITTVAGISSNVTTVAGISSDVTAVAGDATDIGTVATDLAGSDNIGTVAGSISNVNTVGTNIANVNTTAANITGVNSFAERYRVGASDPTTSLDEGDLAYNTTDNALKYYNGTSWASITAGLTDIVGDTTPQLGGNLDAQSNDITSVGNLGVGIASPARAAHFVADGVPAMRIERDTSAGNMVEFRDHNNNTVHVIGTSNVGIGESSPSLGSSGTGLHITGEANKDGTLKLDSSTANYSGVLQFTENGTDQWRIGYDATNNHLEFTESGVSDRMVIKDGGNVGIGTTSPGALLHSHGSTAGDTVLRLSQANSSETFNIKAGISGVDNDAIVFNNSTDGDVLTIRDGNVGIGTSPAGPLEVHKSGGDANVYITTGTTTSSTTILFGDSASDDRGRVMYDHNNDSMRLHTAGSEQMRIDSSGKVGIGTSSPAKPLHINSNVDEIMRLETPDNQTGNIYQSIRDASGELARIGMFDSSRVLRVTNMQSDGDVAFYTNNTEAFRVSPSGQIRYQSEGSTSLRSQTDLRQGAAKMWIKQSNQTTILDSYNVQALTDVATGRGKISINNDMDNVNYAPTVTGINEASNSGMNNGTHESDSNLVGSYIMRTGSSSPQDHDEVTSICHGDLA